MRGWPGIRPATACLVAVIAATICPHAQTPARPGAGSRVIDPKAVAILELMDAAFARADGLSASYRSEAITPAGRTVPSEVVKLTLARPNMYRLDFAGGQTIASNGKTRFNVSGARCATSGVASLNDTREIDTFNPVYWSFYDLGQWQIRSAMLGHWVTKWRLADPGLRTVRYVGKQDLAGTPVDVIEWTYTIGYSRPEDDPLYTSTLFIAADHFPRRIETISSSKAEYAGRRINETISDVKILPKAAASAFAYAPPVGLACQPYNQDDPYITGNYADLPIGSKAPDFRLTSATGEAIHLYDYLKQHKVLLMNYWGYG
jgi:outer membrane lipoprotein-sorting protein